jgi:hypothetical protein
MELLKSSVGPRLLDSASPEKFQKSTKSDFHKTHEVRLQESRQQSDNYWRKTKPVKRVPFLKQAKKMIQVGGYIIVILSRYAGILIEGREGFDDLIPYVFL